MGVTNLALNYPDPDGMDFWSHLQIFGHIYVKPFVLGNAFANIEKSPSYAPGLFLCSRLHTVFYNPDAETINQSDPFSTVRMEWIWMAQ